MVLVRLAPVLLALACAPSSVTPSTGASPPGSPPTPTVPTGATPPADTDGDGLTDDEEAALGTDPALADTDGDGLGDADELAIGTDPLVTDTDGDGYGDRDEVHEGHDPTDPEDRIYVGGWPYWFEKDALTGGSTSGHVQGGERFGRFQFVDQYGDTVDLFDFYNVDKPVVIDMSAVWCGPCKQLSTYLAGEPDGYYEDLWPAGPDAIARGDVYWVTVLAQDEYNGLPNAATAEAWHESYPNDRVPVLADEGGDFEPYVEAWFWPAAWLLEPDLTVVDLGEGFLDSILAELDDRFPQ